MSASVIGSRDLSWSRFGLHASVTSSLDHLLLSAACLEFLLLRVFVRLGPIAPAGSVMDGLFDGLLTLGLVALNSMVVVGLAWLLLGWFEAVRSRAAARGIAAAVAMVAGAAAVGSGLVLPGPDGAVVTAGIVVAAMGLGVLAARCSPRRRLYLLLPLSSYALLAASYAGSGAVLGPSSGFLGAHALAEGVAVGAAIVSPMVLGSPWRGRPALASATIAAAFLVLVGARPWLPGTLLMWNLGFSLWLPLPLYAVGLALFMYTLLARPTGRGGNLPRACLLLLALGCLKLDYGPYALLGLTGLLGLANSGNLGHVRNRDQAVQSSGLMGDRPRRQTLRYSG